jgi:hypothetical protein
MVLPCRSDGVVLSSGRSHFSCTQFPYQGLARPDHHICHPDGESDARNFHIWSSHVWTMKTVVWMSEFWMRDLHYGWARPDGSPHRSDGCRVFPHLCFGKEFHSWLNTEWRPDMLLKRPDGCKMEQFEASQHRGRSRRKVLIVQTDDAWTVECPSGISLVQTAARDPISLTCKLCRIF